MTQPKVLIIGGGFGGLNVAKKLKKAPVDILLIDKSNYHLFQPLLYQVASAALSPSHIAAPIRDILAHQHNIKVLLAGIARIDKEKSQVISEDGEIFSYDYLVLAPGARHSYFGRSNWEKNAPGLKTLNDALLIRQRILLSYERAERSRCPEEAARFMRFVIIGGGPTGVEMAGAIAEIAHKTLVRNFRNIRSEETKIYLVEGTNRVLSSFSKELSERALADLQNLKVEVLLNSFVTEVTDQGVWLGEQFIESPNVIWAAGNEASPLLKTLEIPLDRFGRALVNGDLSIPGNPHIFVIGDAACVFNKKGVALPGIAPVAIQQAAYISRLIKDEAISPFSKSERVPFSYFDKGMMATIGRAKAVAQIGRLKLTGFLAWLTWCFIHIVYLISFSNRILVMFEWLYLYLFNQRRIRLITRPVTDSEDPLKKFPEK